MKTSDPRKAKHDLKVGRTRAGNLLSDAINKAVNPLSLYYATCIMTWSDVVVVFFFFVIWKIGKRFFFLLFFHGWAVVDVIVVPPLV